MITDERLSEQSTFRIEDILASELIKLKKAYKSSCRIKRDMENVDLKKVSARLILRHDILNSLQEIMKEINCRQQSPGNQDEIISIIKEMKGLLAKTANLDKILVQKASNIQNEITNELRNLLQNKNAVISYNKNLNVKSV